MIRKSSQVAAPTTVSHRMALGRITLDPFERCRKGKEQPVSSLIGTTVVVFEGLPEITPYKRVNYQSHRPRKTRNSLRKSSLSIPFTAPDHSSSPRRIASVRLFSSESFGSAPSRLSRISAARSARSPSSKDIANALISESFMRGGYHSGNSLQAAALAGNPGESINQKQEIPRDGCGISNRRQLRIVEFSGNFPLSSASLPLLSNLASLAPWRFTFLS